LITLRKITLYHGNTELVIDQIVTAKCFLPKFKSLGDKHYLGDGFYFYHDEDQAEVWAQMKVTRNLKYSGNNWAVLKCEIAINDDTFMDLDQRADQDFFFKEMFKLNGLLQSGSLEIENYCDSYLCNHLANILDLSVLTKTFAYKDKRDIFPALYSNIKSAPYTITRHFRTEKQYVIRDSAIITKIIKVNSGKADSVEGVGNSGKR
jgi:hypothetical protein